MQPAKFTLSAQTRVGLVALTTVMLLNLWLLRSLATSGISQSPDSQSMTALLRASDAVETETPAPAEGVREPVGFRPRRTHLFSFADRPQQQVCLLAAGAAQYGYTLNVLSWDRSEHFADKSTCGQPCKMQGDMAKAHERKIYWQYDLTHKYADYGIHDDDLIVFMDAFDVLVQSDPARIADLFLQLTRHQRGVVFNGEPTVGNSFMGNNKYSEMLRRGSYEVQLTTNHARRNVTGGEIWKMMAAKTLMKSVYNGPFFGLNSGIFVGDALTLRAFFERVMQVRELMMVDGFRGDQILYQVAYLRYPELNLVVDAAAAISYVFSFFYSVGDVDLFSERQEGNETVTECHATEFLSAATPGGKVHYSIDTEPVFMHFPGKTKSLYDDVCWLPAWQVLADTMADNATVLRDFDRGVDVPLSSFCRMPSDK